MSLALRHLSLDRPLAVVDIETTGLDPGADRVVEVAVVVLDPGAEPVRYRRLVDPGVPIPEAASAIHGITDTAVAGMPRFEQIARELVCLLDGADLAGYNLRRFDLSFLAAEFRRAGVDFPVAGRAVVDAQQIFHRFEPRDLAAAVRRYCGREHDGAHSALADAEATAAVLDAQVGAHDGLPADVAGLHELLVEVDVGGKFRREGKRILFAFGKYAGRRLRDVARDDPNYLQWFLREDFLDDAKAIVERALERARRKMA